MKEDPGSQTLPRRTPILLALAILTTCGTPQGAMGKPNPPTPPLPSWCLLYLERFDDPAGAATNAAPDTGTWIESWSGYALNRGAAVVPPWRVPALGAGRAQVDLRRGALRFWYRPDCGSVAAGGSGPGGPAVLARLVSASGPAVVTWWSLEVGATGNDVSLFCQGSNGPAACLSASVAWAAGNGAATARLGASGRRHG